MAFGFIGDAAKWAGRQVTHGAKAVGSVAKVASHGVSTVTKPLERLPIVGKGIHATLAVTPIGLAQKIAEGARLDKAVLSDLRDKVQAAKDVAPYVSTVVSVVPGVGTGVAAAIGAGAALAEGRPITEAILAAARAAVPGGAAAQMGFDVAQRMARGQNVTEAALQAARAQLPPGAQAAFDVSLALVTGEKLQTALLRGVATMGPAELARVTHAGELFAAASPVLRAARGKLPKVQVPGYDVAMGFLAHSGVSPAALELARQKVPAAARAGFDAAIKLRSSQVKENVLAQARPGVVVRALTANQPKKRAAARLLIRKIGAAAKAGDREAAESLRALKGVRAASNAVVAIENGHIRIHRGPWQVKQ